MKAIGITSPFTGSGKTLVTMGLLNKYKNSIGVKVGPDYIDGMFHTFISGYRTLNIDRWIQGKKWRNFLSSVPEITEFASRDIFCIKFGIATSYVDKRSSLTGFTRQRREKLHLSQSIKKGK